MGSIRKHLCLIFVFSVRCHNIGMSIWRKYYFIWSVGILLACSSNYLFMLVLLTGTSREKLYGPWRNINFVPRRIRLRAPFLTQYGFCCGKHPSWKCRNNPLFISAPRFFFLAYWMIHARSVEFVKHRTLVSCSCSLVEEWLFVPPKPRNSEWQ